MREIKFRAKTKKGKWLIGMPTYDFKYIFNDRQYDSVDNYEIVKDTVSQFTGIKDYSDNEIYEGDIISPISSEGYPYLVKFNEGEFCLYSKVGRWGSISKMRPVCDKLNLKINVIGNIYENPELL